MALKPPEAPLHNLPDASTSDQDARELARLGYAQELHAVADGNDLEARTQVMAAAIMGATAFQKGLGAVHSLRSRSWRQRWERSRLWMVRSRGSWNRPSLPHWYLARLSGH